MNTLAGDEHIRLAICSLLLLLFLFFNFNCDLIQSLFVPRSVCLYLAHQSSTSLERKLIFSVHFEGRWKKVKFKVKLTVADFDIQARSKSKQNFHGQLSIDKAIRFFFRVKKIELIIFDKFRQKLLVKKLEPLRKPAD